MRRAADENIHENIRLLGRLLCSHHKGHTLPFHVSQPFTVVVEYYNDYGDEESSLMTAVTMIMVMTAMMMMMIAMTAMMMVVMIGPLSLQRSPASLSRLQAFHFSH